MHILNYSKTEQIERPFRTKKKIIKQKLLYNGSEGVEGNLVGMIIDFLIQNRINFISSW